MGVLENTRSLGDFKYKPFGLTPEPEVRQKLLKGNSHPSLCLLFFEHITTIQVRNFRTSS